MRRLSSLWLIFVAVVGCVFIACFDDSDQENSKYVSGTDITELLPE